VFADLACSLNKPCPRFVGIPPSERIKLLSDCRINDYGILCVETLIRYGKRVRVSPSESDGGFRFSPEPQITNHSTRRPGAFEFACAVRFWPRGPVRDPEDSTFLGLRVLFAKQILKVGGHQIPFCCAPSAGDNRGFNPNNSSTSGVIIQHVPADQRLPNVHRARHRR
jgi:hypothetical protein